MAAGMHDLMLRDKIKKLYLKIICEWITWGWGPISEEIINSFMMATISNTTDGTEHNCVWEENKEDE
jgi:hypothetical protein